MDGQSKVLRLILLLLRFHCIVLNVLGANDFFAIIGTETLQSTVHRLQDLQGCSAFIHLIHSTIWENGKQQIMNVMFPENSIEMKYSILTLISTKMNF